MFDPERDGLGGSASDDLQEFPALAAMDTVEVVTKPVTPVQVSSTPAVAPTKLPTPQEPMGWDKNTIALIVVLGLLYFLLSRRNK